MGPLACIVVGANFSENIKTNSEIEWDCWKPVLHDQSVDPSQGILLKDLVQDKRIKNVFFNSGDSNECGHLVLTNIWEENFRVDFVKLPSIGNIAAHAKHLN